MWTVNTLAWVNLIAHIMVAYLGYLLTIMLDLSIMCMKLVHWGCSLGPRCHLVGLTPRVGDSSANLENHSSTLKLV